MSRRLREFAELRTRQQERSRHDPLDEIERLKVFARRLWVQLEGDDRHFEAALMNQVPGSDCDHECDPFDPVTEDAICKHCGEVVYRAACWIIGSGKALPTKDTDEERYKRQCKLEAEARQGPMLYPGDHSGE